jgi:hypothetical protein
MQWSFLLSQVAGEVGRKSAGLGACGIVQGGKGFVTETCRVHKFVSVVFWVLGGVEMSCNCLSFLNNEYVDESWAFVPRSVNCLLGRCCDDALRQIACKDLPILLASYYRASSLGGSTITLSSPAHQGTPFYSLPFKLLC